MKTTTNKEQLVEKIALETGFTKKDTKIFLEGFIKVTGTVLQEDGEIQLVGFGKFGTRDIAEKSGVCKLQKDSAGNVIETPFTTEAHKQPFFKVGKGLKDKANAK